MRFTVKPDSQLQHCLSERFFFQPPWFMCPGLHSEMMRWNHLATFGYPENLLRESVRSTGKLLGGYTHSLGLGEGDRSMGHSRQEYWSWLPCPSPGDLPDPGIEPRPPALQADALTSEPPHLEECKFFLTKTRLCLSISHIIYHIYPFGKTDWAVSHSL